MSVLIRLEVLDFENCVVVNKLEELVWFIVV